MAHELCQQRKRLEPAELCVLKAAYGLSMQGCLYRAHDLNVLTEKTYQDMRRLFVAKSWNKQDPGPLMNPSMFMQLVFHACAEDLINESKAAELLGTSLTEFRPIRNVESCGLQTTHQ